MNTVRPVKTLNCKGYKCPLPQVQAKEALGQIEDLEIIEILTTDPDAEKEIRKWTEHTGDIYIANEQKCDHVVHFIQKALSHKRKEERKYSNVILNDDLKQKDMDDSSFTILDVREEIEFFIGHIPEAVNLPLGEVKDHLVKLNKNQTYYIICRTGNRSDFACHLLAENGFLNVYNVLPGMSEWDGEIE